MSRSETGTFRSILFVFAAAVSSSSSSVSLPKKKKKTKKKKRKNRLFAKNLQTPPPERRISLLFFTAGRQKDLLSLSLSLKSGYFGKVFLLLFCVFSPLRFKLLHDFQKLVVRLFPIFQAIFQVSQVTQRVLFSRGVVDCPACCDRRRVTREREPWLLSVEGTKRERERESGRFGVSRLVRQGGHAMNERSAQCACAIFPQPIGVFWVFGLFFSNLKEKNDPTSSRDRGYCRGQREKQREIEGRRCLFGDAPLGHDDDVRNHPLSSLPPKCLCRFW